jgi:hypothetical protein
VANTNPQILTYEFDAEAAQVSVTLPVGDNATLLLLEIAGIGSFKIAIFPEGYGPGEAQYNPATKLLLFGDPLVAGTHVKILYVDVDSVIPVGARTVGDGSYRTVGDGNYRTTT